MSVDPDHAEFYLNGSRSEYLYDTLALTHSAWAQPIYLVRNRRAGLTATLETAASVAFIWRPMRIVREAARDDMDLAMRIEIGDLGAMIPALVDAIRAADGFGEYPEASFRTFRSTDLTAPHEGPITLQVNGLARSKSGALLDLGARHLNLNRTGVRDSIAENPLLRALA